MTWALIAVLAAHSIYLHLRVRSVARDVRRMGLVWHEAANRAMRRHRRDAWRFREIKSTLGIIADFTESPVDVPDLEAGPPDDPDSG